MRRLAGRLSLRARLTFTAGLAVALAVAAVAAVAWFLVRGQLRAQVDGSLAAQAETVQQQLHGPGNRAFSSLLQPEPGDDGRLRLRSLVSAAELVGADGAAMQVPLPGQRLSQLADPKGYAEVATGARPQVLRDGTLVDGTHVRVIATTGFVDESTGARYALVLARSLSETDTTLSRLALLLLGFGGLGVLAAAGGGLLVARAGLRPVDRLTAAAEHVARTEDLDVPIAVRGDDEVARLARSFNAMTAALSASRRRQSQLVADAGHELRTPLTSLRTNLELLARSERSGRDLPPEDRRRLLADVGAQVAELGTLVGELVDLARDERTAEEPRPLDLAEVTGRALERARRRAGDVRLSWRLSPWPVVGQPAALERAVLNLVDNAVKFSPPGGTVDVALAGGEVTVADRGPGVAAEDQPHVFERFYRAAEARGLPGSGLGLAIVAQTAAQHAGFVRLEGRSGGGTVARLWVPGSAAAGAGSEAAASSETGAGSEAAAGSGAPPVPRPA